MNDPDYIVLALWTNHLERSLRMVEIVRLKLPTRGKLKKWKPEVGQPIPPGIKYEPQNDYEKVLVVPTEEEQDFLQGLIVLSNHDSLTDVFTILCAKCIDGTIGELSPDPQ